MKTTNTLQRIAAGMLTFSLVVMFAVLGFGLTKPVWAAGESWIEVNSLESLVNATNGNDYKKIRLMSDIHMEHRGIQLNGILDLNGYVIDFDGTGCMYAPPYAGECCLTVIDSRPDALHLYTIEDGLFVVDDTLDVNAAGVHKLYGGVVTNAHNDSGSAGLLFTFTNTQNIVINGGNFVGNTGLVSNFGGSTLTVNGGYFGGNGYLFYNNASSNGNFDFKAGEILISDADVTAGVVLPGEKILDADKNLIGYAKGDTVLESMTPVYDTDGVTVLGYAEGEPAPVPEPEPTPVPGTDTAMKDDNKKEDNFPWAGVIIGGVAVTATVAAIAVACLAVRRK